jgi:hypothetical protein
LDPESQAQLTARVQDHVQRTLALQKNGAANQQTVQGAYQQAQTFLQQAQRNVMPLQPGQGMTPEQQRILAPTKQQFLGGADPELIRQQLAQQGRQMPPNEVQAMLQQQLLARQQQQNAAAQQAQQRQQQPPPQNLAQQRQMGLQQAAAAAAQGLKLPNGQQMTPEQVQLYRARQLQLQAVRAQQQQSVNNMGGIGLPMQQFLNSLSQENKAQFQSMDGQSQASVFTNWMATRQAAHQQQQQQQQQSVQQGVPQLQYNPMAAQNMAGAGRMPVPMVGMAQGQGTPNGVGGPTMMRQSTSGGGA